MDNIDNIYTLCSDNDMVLEHEDDTNNFRLTFNVLEKYDNVVEIIKDNALFKLIYEVNNTIITEYRDDIKDNVNQIELKINTPKDYSFKNTYGDYFVLRIGYSLKIKDNEVILINNKFINNKNNNSNSDIWFDNFNISTKELSNGCLFTVLFTFDKNVNDTMNKFCALYIKKLIKNLKLYFDMVSN
jgi:hypothetical protein